MCKKMNSATWSFRNQNITYRKWARQAADVLSFWLAHPSCIHVQVSSGGFFKLKRCELERGCKSNTSVSMNHSVNSMCVCMCIGQVLWVHDGPCEHTRAHLPMQYFFVLSFFPPKRKKVQAAAVMRHATERKSEKAWLGSVSFLYISCRASSLVGSTLSGNLIVISVIPNTSEAKKST